MPTDPEVIPALTRWGLSTDADLIYRALALLGPADGHRLARELGLARARTTSALDELAAAGATTPAGTAWSARAPADVLRRLRRRPNAGGSTSPRSASSARPASSTRRPVCGRAGR